MAKYGGVVIDITYFLMPYELQIRWKNFVEDEKDFFAYVYDPVGENIGKSTTFEFTAVWFLMAKEDSKIMQKYKNMSLAHKVPGQKNSIYGANIWEHCNI